MVENLTAPDLSPEIEKKKTNINVFNAWILQVSRISKGPSRFPPHVSRFIHHGSFSPLLTFPSPHVTPHASVIGGVYPVCSPTRSSLESHYWDSNHQPVKGLRQTMSTLRQTFLDELACAYDAEKQLIKALPKMAKAAQHEELRQGFEQHLEQT